MTTITQSNKSIRQTMAIPEVMKGKNAPFAERISLVNNCLMIMYLLFTQLTRKASNNLNP